MTDQQPEQPEQPQAQVRITPQVSVGTEVVRLTNGKQMVAMTMQVTVFFEPEEAIQFGRSMVHEGQQSKTGIVVADAQVLGQLKLG